MANKTINNKQYTHKTINNTHTFLDTFMQTHLSANQSARVLSLLFINVAISCAVVFKACLHGGGGPQIGEVTCGRSPHLSRKRNQIKNEILRGQPGYPPKGVTSPTWGPPPPCKQALRPLVFCS